MPLDTALTVFFFLFMNMKDVSPLYDEDFAPYSFLQLGFSI